MATFPHDPNRDRPQRRHDLRIVIALLAGSLVTLAILTLAGRTLMGSLVRAPTPTAIPSPTPVSRAAVVQQIQRLSRLETSSYSVQTVVTAERPGGLFGIGGQKVLLVVHGTVVAGIDLNKLQPENVTVSSDGKRI